MNIEQKIEAILFYKNEPMEIKKLAKLLNVEETGVKEAIKNLSNSLNGRGICLLETDTEVSLATAPGMKDEIEQIAKDEMKSEIGKAGLETLAIVLYNGPISRREIDYIRGVNSTYILRNLSIRGLIERDNDAKGVKYKGSINLLATLGIKELKELPEFESLRQKINELQVTESTSEQ